MVIALQAGGHQNETGRGLSLHFAPLQKRVVKLDPKRSNQHCTALAQGQSARLITWRSSDQNPQAVFYNSVALQKRQGTQFPDVKLDVKRSNQHCYRCGAAEARGAHNSEDT